MTTRTTAISVEQDALFLQHLEAGTSMRRHGFSVSKGLRNKHFSITQVDNEVVAAKPYRAAAIVGHDLWTLNELDRACFQNWTIDTMNEFLSSNTIFSMSSRKFYRPDRTGAKTLSSYKYFNEVLLRYQL